ncbi:hypothetical protein PTI98_009886 [Pleurotus ostreatus]|nr:hypothetical protein PTI98_009886 [Pleurotus ostreatus]
MDGRLTGLPFGKHAGMLHVFQVRGRVNAADYVGKQAKKREILDSPNYEGFGKPPALFDVTHFDINAAHEGLSAALASTNSVRSGAKTYTMPLHPDAMNTNIDQLKKGQSMVRDFSPDSHGYWQETTSTKKDKKSETVCGLCGKPGGAKLKTCSGCRVILFVVLSVRCLSEADL